MNDRWWICTAPLRMGGTKVVGPFGTQDLALQVRGLIDPEGKIRYWVDDEEDE